MRGLRNPTRDALLESLLVFVVLSVLLQNLIGVSCFTIFQARDLDRARLLAAGHAIFFGPEMTGGGHLPGGFYYLLLSIPLKLGLGWKGAWELEIGMMAATAAVLWFFSRRHFGIVSAWIVLASVLLSVAMLNNLQTFMNPSFAPLFYVLAFILLCRVFVDPANGAGTSWRIFCLVCALGIQLHFTVFFALLAGVVLQLCAAQLELRAMSKKDFAFGLLAFLAVLLPYGLWCACKVFSIPLGQPDVPFTGMGHRAWYSLSGWIAQELRSEGAGAYLRSIVLITPIGILLAAACFVVLAGSARRKPSPSPEFRFIEGSITVFTVVSELMLLPCLFMRTPQLFSRYAGGFIVACGLLAGALAARLEAECDRSFRRFAAAGILGYTAWEFARRGPSFPFEPKTLLMIGLIVAVAGLMACRERLRDSLLPSFLAIVSLACLISWRGYDSYSLYPASHSFSTMSIAEMKAMSRDIYAQTGWDYAEVKRRIFYFNTSPEFTLSYVYRGVASGYGPSRLNLNISSGAASIDGFFVGHLALEDSGLNREPKEYLLDQDVEATLKNGIASEDIRLGTAAVYGRLAVIPYEIMNKEDFPPFFRSHSDGYSIDVPAAPPASSAAGKYFRLAFNDSPSGQADYDFFFDVRLASAAPGQWEVRVVLSGEPISQSSYNISPEWTQSLIRPYLTYDCDGNDRLVRLAELIGMTRGKERAFLAPYERRFHVTCSGRIENMSVGYESSVAYADFQELPSLPGKRKYLPLLAEAR